MLKKLLNRFWPSVNAKAQVSINGGDIVGGHHIQVDRYGNVRVDGDLVAGDLAKGARRGRLEITVRVLEGTIGQLEVSGDVHCGAVDGDIEAQGDVTCGTVRGNVEAQGDVKVTGRIEGRASAQGDIRMGY